jgi:predicted metal-dependent hydrolase
LRQPAKKAVPWKRVSLGRSPKAANHKRAIALLVSTHSFCKAHRVLKTTPAAKSGLTDRAYTVEELLSSLV